MQTLRNVQGGDQSPSRTRNSMVHGCSVLPGDVDLDCERPSFRPEFLKEELPTVLNELFNYTWLKEFLE